MAAPSHRSIAAAAARVGLLALGLLAARAALAAITIGSPTITPWRNDATSAYSIVHDDTCDFSTPGIDAHWQEATTRGLKLSFGAISTQCRDRSAQMIPMLAAMVAAGHEIVSHSAAHCDHTRASSDRPPQPDSSCKIEYGVVPNTTFRPLEMNGSKTWLQSNVPGAGVDFYAFPYDAYNAALLTQLQGFGYLGARGGTRPAHPVNQTFDPSADPLIDFKVQYDVYDTDDSGGNASVYPGPYPAPTFTSLTAYLDDVVSHAGWGVQELHGIGDASYGTVALATYQLHLDDLVTRQNSRQVWVAPPTEVIRYRRSRYHCGPITKSGEVLTFSGAASPGCQSYATTVTVKIPVSSGETAIAAKQGTAPNEKWLAVRADGASNFFVDANPVDGPITVVDAAAPAITSPDSATFTVGSAGSFSVTATGARSPAISASALPAGVTFTPTTGTPFAPVSAGLLAGTPAAAGTYVLTFTATNDAAPTAAQTFTLTVARAAQAILFDALPDVQLGSAPITVSAVGGGSGAPVTFAAGGSCSSGGTNGGTITIATLGTCSVVANQAGDANYLDAAPVLRTFEVIDTVAPETVITSANPSTTNSESATFTFTGADSSNLLVSFECSLDGAPFAACASPRILAGLGAGSHTFAVRGKDSADNVDPSPAAFTWTVDLVPPTIAFVSRPPVTLANQASYAVGGDCSEDGQSVSVQIGSIAAGATCGLPVSGQFVTTGVDASLLPEGPVDLQASITDLAGNPTTVTDSTTKDTMAPALTLATLSAIANANQTAYGFAGACEAGGGDINYTLLSIATVTGATTCASGAYMVAGLDLSSLADSLTVAVNVSQTDAVGNPATAAGSAVKDTIDPSLAIDEPLPINGENQNGYVVAGDCSEAGRNVTVTIGPVAGVGPIIATAVCGVPAATRYQTGGMVVPRAMPEGNVPISASTTDDAGNSALALAAAVKDTTPDVFLVSDINPATPLETVTLTATLGDYSQVHLPTGTVAFKTGGSPIAGCGSQAVNPGGIYALCFFSPGVGGAFAITAEYSGDGNYNPAASGVLNQLVVAPPIVAAPASALITATTATLGGNVVSDGASTITERGVVYARTATNGDPLIGGTGVTQVTVGGTTGLFATGVTGLAPLTGHSFKAYATNAIGTSYTSVASFTTTCPVISLASLPNGNLTVEYTGSAAASGGTGPYTYAVTSGTLPSGLTLTTSGAGAGNVGGTPTVAGTFTFDITATDTSGAGACTGVQSYSVSIGPEPGRDFYTVTPCRVLDTRNAAGPLGGPALVALADRTFVIAGACGIPADAKAVSLNLAVTGPTNPGNIRLHPGGTSAPLASSINFKAGQTRSNNAVIPLSALGELAAYLDQASGTAHLIVDVNGYFK